MERRLKSSQVAEGFSELSEPELPGVNYSEWPVGNKKDMKF